MAKQAGEDPADNILPLYLHGLSGRMLRMSAPPRKKREILFIYGHHASLERHYGIAEFLNQFGAVTVPDLPGFGGMEAFYKIGETPTLDNMADYLAAFIKLRYKGRRFTLGGFSLGTMIITRMLQKYPEIAKKVDLLVSVAGFAHKDDFIFKRRTFYLFYGGTWFFSRRLPAAFLKYIAFREPIIKLVYKLVEDKNIKLLDASPEERAKRVAFEVVLWQCNDPRTYMYMGHTMFSLNLRGTHVDLPIHHVFMDNDRYFNRVKVEEHMREIYSDFYGYKIKEAKAHSPSIVATKEEAAFYIPPKLRVLLRKKV